MKRSAVGQLKRNTKARGGGVVALAAPVRAKRKKSDVLASAAIAAAAASVSSTATMRIEEADEPLEQPDARGIVSSKKTHDGVADYWRIVHQPAHPDVKMRFVWVHVADGFQYTDLSMVAKISGMELFEIRDIHDSWTEKLSKSKQRHVEFGLDPREMDNEREQDRLVAEMEAEYKEQGRDPKRGWKLDSWAPGGKFYEKNREWLSSCGQRAPNWNEIREQKAAEAAAAVAGAVAGAAAGAAAGAVS